MKKFELKPHRGQKSFYKKAHYFFDNGCTFLQSYNTVVAVIDAEGHFFRTWEGYSPTTMRHVNAFRVLFGFSEINKKQWDCDTDTVMDVGYENI